MESLQNNSGTAKGRFTIQNKAQPSDVIWEIPTMLVVDQESWQLYIYRVEKRKEWVIMEKEVHVTRTGLENHLWDCVGYEALLYMYY